MDVCLRVLKESNKSRFDSYSVSNSVLITYYLSGLSRAHFFRPPFSKKLHIQGGKTIEHKSPIRLNHNLIFFAIFRGLDHVCQKLLCRVQETEKFTFI